MKFDVLTLFPEMFEALNHSILKKAQEKNIIQINVTNIRDFAYNKHKKVDDYPYGGGAGMVMQPEPIYNAVDYIVEKYGYKPYTVIMSPRGKRFEQRDAKRLVEKGHILMICGHYEGIDERVLNIVDEEISIGDFVLTGGEIASMAIIDCISRLVPGVLQKQQSYEDESFYDGLLEYPQYTRPEEFRGMRVPEVLLSGHHENIRKWRKYQSLKITYERRPDLLKNKILTKEEQEMLNDIIKQNMSLK
ncbi:tRNA (guanosine(37)-N1)-methyltransferase TrmD [Thermobrachium celere]|uniref:tRNA (guanosine(37)-N1)-methyltransferase TrmD n=1 Tax=Thermobrachium celere TaxID=53422 RepID=UPI001944F1AF|nr:tRNA (guanosine(37)-N1)-methyltransferase TrmD [Thermobrachium celere]GFR35848.1 tRNA (guanine-N(1)-)-methyltransferase [Thermobrachium celere]